MISVDSFLEEFLQSNLEAKVQEIAANSESVIKELADKVEARLHEARQIPNVV